MTIQLLQITVKRDGSEIGPEVSREIVGELPDNPYYWDPLCDFLLRKMVRDGVIPDPEEQRR